MSSDFAGLMSRCCLIRGGDDGAVRHSHPVSRIGETWQFYHLGGIECSRGELMRPYFPINGCKWA
jgi:hypothetical protein